MFVKLYNKNPDLKRLKNCQDALLDAQSVVQEEQIGERMLAPERYWVELTDFKIDYPEDQFPEKYPIKADDIVQKMLNGALTDGIFVQT